MRITVLPKVQRFLLVMMAVLIPSLTFAQSYTLTGVVNDDSGNPLPGTTIIKNNSTEGTISGADGSFELPVSRGDVLTFSYVGYMDQNITISGQTRLTVTMQPDATKLEDVVVVGYGRMRKADVTAAISSVDVEELKTVGVTNPMAALQGRVSGVNITKSGGLAGSSVSVQIRGISTTGNSEPLYIIDGFPGSISAVSPSDIESLQILKDGAASAIYGSEAASGVVIITTKSGKKGNVVVDVNAYIGMRQISKNLEMLDADGFLKVQQQIYENAGQLNKMPKFQVAEDPAQRVNTNWQDAMFRNGFQQNYSVNVSGGSDLMTVAAAANISKDLGISIGNNYDRQDAYVKAQLKKYVFTFDAKVAYMGNQYTSPQYSLKDVYMISPIVPVYSDQNDFTSSLYENTNYKDNPYGLTSIFNTTAVSNPMGVQENRSAQYGNQRVEAQGNITIDFTDWLSFKSGYSYSVNNYRRTQHYNKFIANTQQPNDYPSNTDYRTQLIKQTITNTLTFDKQFGKNSLNIMLGMQMDLQDYNELYASVTGSKTEYSVSEDGKLQETTVPAGFPDPSWTTINAGDGGTYSASGYYNEYNRLSYFGRVNYNYDNRYLVQATVRRDASSYFGANNRWGTFPSVALGWRITQENFFPQGTAVDELKIRASYGQIGSESALWPYAYESLMNASSDLYGAYVQGGNVWSGMYAQDMENKDLKWETTESINAGVDYAFFNNRLSGSFNYYQTTTKDLLIEKVVPPSAAVKDPTMNVGTMRNSGIEFEARWEETRGDWTYNVGLILYTTKNRVLSLSNDNQTIPGVGLKYGTAHFPNGTRVGGPIGGYYILKTDGIFQSDAEAEDYTWTDPKTGKTQRVQPAAQAGDIKFVDKNNDGQINDDDRYEMGTGIPKVSASISLGFSWKGIDFNALIGSGWGNKLYNGNRYLYESLDSGSNMLASALNAWTPENPNTDIPRAVLGDPNGNATFASDRFLEKGDFIRLRQVQIGYTLPQHLTKKIYIDRIRFYVSGDNLLTWTKYSGIDPEFSSSLFSTGVDNLIYPFTRAYIFGVQITF